MKQRSGAGLGPSHSLQGRGRALFWALVAASFALALLSRTESPLGERARTTVADQLTPLLSVLADPLRSVQSAVDELRALAVARDENAHLKAELAELKQWRDAALRLAAENKALRDVANFTQPTGGKSVGGRVVASSGGLFARSLLIAAGAEQGVAKGFAAMTRDGLVGRVVEVGERSARVLLLTDLNSKIPVAIEGSRFRAVLAGDNTATPRMLYLPQEARVNPGDRVVTSGVGGGLPPGLPIGVIEAVNERGVQVRPFVDWQRLDYVMLMDAAPTAGGLETQRR